MSAARPTPAEYEAASKTVSAFIADPETGWSSSRFDDVAAQLRRWSVMLDENARHAACDAEKS